MEFVYRLYFLSLVAMFKQTPPPVLAYTAQQLADFVGATVLGCAEQLVSSIAPIERAKSGELTFIAKKNFLTYLEKSQASVIILQNAPAIKTSATLILAKNPELAYAKIASLFEKRYESFSGIHATAIVDETAKIDSSATIGPYCIIGANVVIGAHTVLHGQVVVSAEVEIGNHCILYSHVTLYPRTKLGHRVNLHSGVILGAEGFGLANDQGKWHKIPQLGRVIIEDDVDIGANTTIDRGAIEDTLIETGVKIDNLVQIGHNCRIGAHTAIAGCVGIAGSTTVGRHCLIGGAASINGHIQICDGTMIAGTAMVTKSIKTPGFYASGTGLQEAKDWKRSLVRFHQLDHLAKRLSRLERLDSIEKGESV